MKSLLKLIFAGLIIGWLFQSGKLDFSLILQSFQSGYNWLYCILFITIQDAISALRWKILLETKSKVKLPFHHLIRVTWIGLFFNSFLPGAVTGDFIKLIYVRDLDQSLSKTFLVTSVLIDRIIGLVGLLLILGISTGLYYEKIISLSSSMEPVLIFNAFLFIGAISFIVALFLPNWAKEKIINFSKNIPLIGEKISRTLESVWTIGKNKKVVLMTVAISVFLQFLNMLAFWTITHPFYSSPLPLSHTLSFLPLGFIATAIPIAPAGLGVGHVAFEQLFSQSGISGGASFFNLYFVCLIFVNSFGVIPYLLNKKNKTNHPS